MSFSPSTPINANPPASHFPEPKGIAYRRTDVSQVGEVLHDATAAQAATAELHRQRAEIELDEGVDYFGVQGALARAKLEGRIA